jgi:hypothetical protein
MNLTDSMKFVLRNKGRNIFTEFWKEDLKIILKDVKQDLGQVIKRHPDEKTHGNLKDWKESAFDAVTVIRHTPKRVKNGFAYFREDFLKELENQTDSKEKAVFCLKVLGALTSFAASAVYGVRKAKTNISLPGLRTKNAFTHFLIAELVLKLSLSFIHRFILEVEKQISEPEEKNKLKFFKKMLSDKSLNPSDELPQSEPGDKAFEMVEAFKRFILTGERANENQQ